MSRQPPAAGMCARNVSAHPAKPRAGALRRIKAAAPLAAILLAGAPAMALAPQWPCQRGDSSGRASVTFSNAPVISEWHYMYKGARRYKPGLAVWASPAIAVVAGRPMAFIGGYDQTMHALDLADKRAAWSKLTNGEIQNAPVIGVASGLDAVFWGSADRTVYAFVAYSGRMLWTRELVRPSSSQGDVEMSSPLFMDGRLYIACFAFDKSLLRNSQQGVLYCLDAENGQVLWQELVCDGPTSSPLGFQRDGRAYVAIAARRGLLQCYDVSGARPRRAWSFQMPHETLGSPVAADCAGRTLLFLGSKYGNLIALDAATGKEVWQKMVGNWFDNGACVGDVGGRKIVFAGAHDYNLYALDARDGALVWKKALGGEIHSAPCLLPFEGRAAVAVAALDNHLYVLDAATGDSRIAYFTGNPIWDKLVKGETLWGSPAAIVAGKQTALVYGAFNDVVYTIPVEKECSLTASARSAASLWKSLLFVAALFCGLVVPLIVRFAQGRRP